MEKSSIEKVLSLAGISTKMRLLCITKKIHAFSREILPETQDR